MKKSRENGVPEENALILMMLIQKAEENVSVQQLSRHIGQNHALSIRTVDDE